MLTSLRPSTYAMGSYVNLGSFGVTGVKRSFSLKCYNSSMLQSMTIKLIHIDQLENLYLCCGVTCQSGGVTGQTGVIWDHWSQKSHFHQKYYNFSMLRSMTIRLIHVDQLETFYLCYGVTCQSGIILGHGVKRSFSLKML